MTKSKEGWPTWPAEIIRLEKINAALLEALEALEPHLDGDSEGPSNAEIEQARAAIRAAKGEGT